MMTKGRIKVVQYEPKKLPMKFDISMLNKLIGYIFKSSSQITRKALNNMKKLFDQIDEKVYEGNDQLETRLYFINRALEARVVKGFEDEGLIINYCRTANYNKELEEIIKNLEIYKKINYEEIKFINKAIQDRLTYAYILTYKDKMYETVERIDAGDFNTYQEISDDFTKLCTEFITESRKVRVLEESDTLCLSDENYEDKVTDIVNRLKDPSRILKVGIKMWNQILAPGYISGRVYMYLGLPGGFKSGILLKTVRDIKKYNKGIQTKKPGKRPCILLITAENSVEETFERLFNMTVTADDIRNFTPKQVIKKLKDEGEIALTSDEDIDIIIKYYDNRELDTTDLYTIIDELSDDNKEVIAFVLDYIKRVRPTEKAKDEKEELKNITNELKSLAKHYDIPVISAHQLNRSGAIAIDAAMQDQKEDLARFVGRGNVGSAWEVMENADWTCIINIEKKKGTENYYLTFKRVKIRYRDPNDIGYFNHPFVSGNRMMLIDDVELDKCLSETSLATDFEGVDLTSNKGKRTAIEREVIDDDEDDIFDFKSTINSKK